MNVLFRLFGDIQFNSLVLSTESYPPLALRRAIAVNSAMNFVMNHWNPKLEHESAMALRDAMQYTELAFATILGNAISSKGLKDAFSPLGHDHRRRLINFFKDGLTEKLAPFAYEFVFV